MLMPFPEEKLVYLITFKIAVVALTFTLNWLLPMTTDHLVDGKNAAGDV